MERGTWRVARGWKELILRPDDGEEYVVETASGVPPTGGGLDMTLGANTSRYERDEDGAIRCLYFDGVQVLWQRGPTEAPVAPVDAPKRPARAKPPEAPGDATEAVTEALEG